jgi:hypothetical protein
MMPGAIRPNKKAMKIAYDILNTPKDRRQKNEKPSRRLIREWLRDSIAGQ